jgi:hypothetical protein
MSQIIQNAIRIIDKDIILYSRSTHDYVEKDGYMVDGGTDYQRYGYPDGKKDNFENLILYDLDNFDILKKKIIWGTYGKDGKQSLRFIKLINAEIDHLEALLKQKNIYGLKREIILSIINDRSIITRRNKILKIIKQNGV